MEQKGLKELKKVCLNSRRFVFNLILDFYKTQYVYEFLSQIASFEWNWFLGVVVKCDIFCHFAKVEIAH